MKYIELSSFRINTSVAVLGRLSQLLRRRAMQSNRLRHISAAMLSVMVHALFFGGYIGVSVLDKPQVLEIREVSFVDLTEEPPVKHRPSKVSVPERPQADGRQVGVTQSAATPAPGAESQVSAAQHPAEFNRRMDSIRRQAPISLTRHASIAPAEPVGSDVIRVSRAKGTANDPWVSAAPAISLDREANAPLAAGGTKRIMASAASLGPKISMNERQPDVTPNQAVAQVPDLSSPGPTLTASPARKSRAVITGALSSRRILKKSIPEFPRSAKLRGVGATISMQFAVMEDGRVKENIVVLRTSGSSEWDATVMASLREWIFAPLTDRIRQDQSGVITFQFVID